MIFTGPPIISYQHIQTNMLRVRISVYRDTAKLCIITPLVGRLTTALYRDLRPLPSPTLHPIRPLTTVA